jgi:tight adherence protein C
VIPFTVVVGASAPGLALVSGRADARGLPWPAGSVAGIVTAAEDGRAVGLVATLLGAAWAVAVAAMAAGALRRHTHRRPTDPADRTQRPGMAAATGGGPARPGAGQADVSAQVSTPADDQTLAAARRHRRAGPGATGRQGTAATHPRPSRFPRRAPTGRRGSPVTALGAAVRGLAPAAPMRSVESVETGHRAGPDPADHPDERADRRAGWAVVSGLGLLALAPPLATVPLVWSVAAPAMAARRHRAATEARLLDQLPDVVDLLGLTAGAGLPVGAALVALGDRPGGPLGAALARAGAHVRHGGSTAEALGLLRAEVPAARPLVDALAQHDRYGSPLVPALERVAIEARARRRRRAEEAARRLPVTLLLPLVLTTFPAFVLLTVIPLLAGSLGSLSLSPT